MNSIERKMTEVLQKLKNEYGVLAIKAEFEAEGSRLDEMIMLNEVVFRANMDLFIKVGGCEAVRDIDQCKLLGATGIMAPMIETPFAMKKFVGAAKKVYGDNIDEIEWIINTETKTCRENLDDILAAGEGFLNTIAIGRVDLSASMGLGRDGINSDIMFDAVSDFAKRAKEKKLKVGIGGGVSLDTVPILLKLKDCVDKFETRKVVFKLQDNEKMLKQGLVYAMEFEMLYLKNKCEFYNCMAKEDQDRVKMLEKRYNLAKETMGM